MLLSHALSHIIFLKVYDKKKGCINYTSFFFVIRFGELITHNRLSLKQT